METKDLFAAQELYQEIKKIEDFINRIEDADANDKLTHIVIIHQDNTKNIAIPDKFTRTFINSTIQVVNKELEAIKKQFQKL